jgi:carboxypeptidase C (cathepsin A)
MKLSAVLTAAALAIGFWAPAQAQSTFANQCAADLQYRNGQYGNASFGTGVDAESAAILCRNATDRRQSLAVRTCLNDTLYRDGFYYNDNYRTGQNINDAIELCSDAGNGNLLAARDRCLTQVQSLGVSQGFNLCREVRSTQQANGINQCLQDQLFDVGFYNNPRYRTTVSLNEAVNTCTPKPL